MLDESTRGPASSHGRASWREATGSLPHGEHMRPHSCARLASLSLALDASDVPGRMHEQEKELAALEKKVK